MLLNLDDGEVKFRRDNCIVFLLVLFFMNLNISLSVILEGSLSLDLQLCGIFPCFLELFCNWYLRPLNVDISNVEHDFPQLESTEETDSTDVFFQKKFFKNKLVWNKRNILVYKLTVNCISITEQDFTWTVHVCTTNTFWAQFLEDWTRCLEKNKL